ncbi:MAG: cupin [Gammaproteobacteria bacterium]|nr:MAG: cupin [Gammaproteobacteria bacterium]
MSVLVSYDEEGRRLERREGTAAVAEALAPLGVDFERWEADRDLGPGAGQEEILAAYAGPVGRLKARHGFRAADVVALGPDHPQREALRAQFLDEHTHEDFEVRCFVRGRGLFFLHDPVRGRVHAVLCGPGDLISIPAGVPHWFDMGARPELQCIRLFTTPEGWVARYTGSDLARRFPTLEAFLEAEGEAGGGAGAAAAAG